MIKYEMEALTKNEEKKGNILRLETKLVQEDRGKGQRKQGQGGRKEEHKLTKPRRIGEASTIHTKRGSIDAEHREHVWRRRESNTNLRKQQHHTRKQSKDGWDNEDNTSIGLGHLELEYNLEGVLIR
jgi:hypothetical protein